MQATLERGNQQDGAFQPSLFSRLDFQQAAQPRSAPPTRLPGLETQQPRQVKAGRLFSMVQRARLRGGHKRRRQPETGKRYLASVAITQAEAGPHPSPWARDSITVTLAEVGEKGRQIRVVDHRRMEVDNARQSLPGVLQALRRDWRSVAMVTGGAPLSPPAARGAGLRATLGVGLVEAVAAGRVAMYQDDSSADCQEVWAQVVKAQARVASGGLDFFVERGGDDYLLGLALLVAAVDGALLTTGIAIPA